MTGEKNSNNVSEAIAENKRRKRRTKFSYWLMAAAMTVGVVLCVVIAYFIWRAKKLTEVAAIEAEIRQRGEPLTVEELNASYHGAGGGIDKSALFVKLIPKLTNKAFENDLRDYNKALSDFELEYSYQHEHDSEKFTDAWYAEPNVAKFLQKYAALIDEIESAALAEGDVRQLYEMTPDWHEYVDHHFGLREASRLCHTRIEVAARKGDWDTVYRSIRVQYRLGEVLEYEFGLVQAIRSALRNMAHSNVWHWLPVAEFSDEQLRQLRQDCQTVDWQAAHKRRLIGDCAYGRAIFANPGMLGSNNLPPLATPNAEDLRFFLEHMNQRIAATKLPPAKFWAEYDRLISELDDESTYLSKLHGLSRQIVPRVGGIGTISGATFDRITATQIAIELYRRQHDQLPSELASLTPEYFKTVPIDPYDGNPLGYRIEEKAIIVYSIGLNRTDDGGDIESHEDHVVRVRRSDE